LELQRRSSDSWGREMRQGQRRRISKNFPGMGPKKGIQVLFRTADTGKQGDQA
jgi:hypothetical protein